MSTIPTPLANLSRAVRADDPLRTGLAADLAEARERTFQLVASLSPEDLHRQHDALMSPILWDLGHIAAFEELWLTRNLDGPIEFVEMPGLYNPFEHPRRARGALALPGLADVPGRMAGSARGCSNGSADGGPPGRTTRCSATDTCTAWCCSTNTSTTRRFSRRCSSSRARPTARGAAGAACRSRRPSARGRWCSSPAAGCEIGTDDRSAAYDNERPRHAYRLAPFWIDVAPVTNGEYLAFIAAGGYRRESSGRRRGGAGGRSRAPCARSTGRVTARAGAPARWTRAPARPGAARSATSRWHEAEALRPLRRQAPAHRRSSGRRPHRGTRPAERSVPIRGARAPVAGRSPISISSSSARRRWARTRATSRRSAATA